MRLFVCVCVGLMLGGCAGRRVPVTLADASHAPAAASASPSGESQPASQAGEATPQPATPAADKSSPSSASRKDPNGSLSTFMAKVRELSVQARPARQNSPTLEGTDPLLRAALAIDLVDPTPDHKRAVATEYRRLGVFDRAYAYLSQALTISPDDPVTFDAMARLWRDSGFPALGLADAHRSVYFAPASPEARNTLGTILQALGHRKLAREEYEQALKLNPVASYALNNLCYVSLLDGNVTDATALCRRALDAEPGLKAAHNNLALVYETQGDHAAARREFAAAGDDAALLFNTGIVHLARREYRSAVEAFQAAHALRPSMTSALARARQAATAAAAEE